MNLIFSAMGRPEWILHYLYGWGATVHSLPLGSHNARGRPQCIIHYWVATAHSSLLGAPGLLHVLYQCGPQCILKCWGHNAFFSTFMRKGAQCMLIYWAAQCILHYSYEWGATVRSLLFGQQRSGEATNNYLIMGGGRHRALLLLGEPLYKQDYASITLR